MALTLISEIGGQVILGDYTDETIIPGIADGTAKAGELVSLVGATGVVAQTDVDVTDSWIGILLPHYKVDVDTAITGALPCSIVIPKSGHLYGVICIDLNGSAKIGVPVIATTTAGAFGPQTDVEAAQLGTTYSYTDGDTVAIIVWK